MYGPGDITTRHGGSLAPGGATEYNKLIDDGAFCIGDPDHCIRTIEAYEAIGVDQILTIMQVGRVPHEKIMNSIRLFGKYVIPHFQDRERKKPLAGASAT